QLEHVVDTPRVDHARPEPVPEQLRHVPEHEQLWLPRADGVLVPGLGCAGTLCRDADGHERDPAAGLHPERLSIFRVSAQRRRFARRGAGWGTGAASLACGALFPLQHAHQPDGLVLATGSSTALEANYGLGRDAAHSPGCILGGNPGHCVLGPGPYRSSIPDLRRLFARAIRAADAVAKQTATPTNFSRAARGNGCLSAAVVCRAAALHAQFYGHVSPWPG